MKKMIMILCTVFVGIIIGLFIFYGARAYGYEMGYADAQNYLFRQSMLNSTGDGETTIMTHELCSAYRNGYWDGYFTKAGGEEYDIDSNNPYYGVYHTKN